MKMLLFLSISYQSRGAAPQGLVRDHDLGETDPQVAIPNRVVYVIKLQQVDLGLDWGLSKAAATVWYCVLIRTLYFLVFGIFGIGRIRRQ